MLYNVQRIALGVIVVPLLAGAMPIPSHFLARLSKRLPSSDDLDRDYLPRWAIAVVIVGAVAITALSLFFCVPRCRSRDDKEIKQRRIWAGKRIKKSIPAQLARVKLRAGSKGHSIATEPPGTSELSVPPRYEVGGDGDIVELDGKEMGSRRRNEMSGSATQHELQTVIGEVCRSSYIQ